MERTHFPVNKVVKKEDNEMEDESPPVVAPPKKPATSLAARKPKNIDYGTMPSSKQVSEPETEEGEEDSGSFITAKKKLVPFVYVLYLSSDKRWKCKCFTSKQYQQSQTYKASCKYKCKYEA